MQKVAKSAKSAKPAGSTLRFPHAEPPPPGGVIEIADGVLWARVPLPFQLNHVNIFLIDDGDGWAVIDTGVDDAATRATWETLLAGPLAGRRLTRLIVTHYHPDHIGLAGWLCQRFDIPLLTSQTTYLCCLNISLSPNALEDRAYRDFYLLHGLDPETTQLVATRGHEYLRMVHPLPPTFTRLVSGDRLGVGGRTLDVLSRDGHAPEQLMLHSAEDGLFFAADQVLAKITPNVSVWAVDPEGDPLGLYLRSLRELERTMPASTFVLPGHQLPFYGIKTRCRELKAHHDVRCGRIEEACRKTPHSAAELVPVLFPRQLDAHQLSFAFSEVQAHVNYLLRLGVLDWVERKDRVERVVTRAGAEKRRAPAAKANGSAASKAAAGRNGGATVRPGGRRQPSAR